MTRLLREVEREPAPRPADHQLTARQGAPQQARPSDRCDASVGNPASCEADFSSAGSAGRRHYRPYRPLVSSQPPSEPDMWKSTYQLSGGHWRSNAPAAIRQHWLSTGGKPTPCRCTMAQRQWPMSAGFARGSFACVETTSKHDPSTEVSGPAGNLFPFYVLVPNVPIMCCGGP